MDHHFIGEAATLKSDSWTFPHHIPAMLQGSQGGDTALSKVTKIIRLTLQNKQLNT